MHIEYIIHKECLEKVLMRINAGVKSAAKDHGSDRNITCPAPIGTNCPKLKCTFPGRKSKNCSSDSYDIWEDVVRR